jgi:hypothetical protein
MGDHMAVDLASAMSLREFAERPGTELDDQVFSVAAEGFVYPLRLRIEPGADRIFIMLHGAIRRHVKPLPVFSRWNWGKVLKGHVLAVCDPTLYLGRMELGWYLGTGFKHAIPGLVAIAEEARRKLDVKEGRQIFYGSSGGGFAAINAVSMIGAQGRAIAINPQIDLLKYHPRHVNLLARALGRPKKPFDWNSIPSDRTNALDAYMDACERGQRPGVVIAQNTTDDFHLENHYPEFIDAVGLPRIGGYDRENLTGAILYTKPGGHTAGESTDLVKRLCDEAIPFLLKEEHKKKPWWRRWS